MNLSSLSRKAKQVFEKRGGAGAAKEDLAELRDIASREGSIADKAKAAGAALKDPGAAGEKEPRPAGEEPRAAGEEPRTAG
jgi:hypothetical protein